MKIWPAFLPTTRQETFSCDLYYSGEEGVEVKHLTIDVESHGETDAEAVKMNNAKAWARIREEQVALGGATTANYRNESIIANGRRLR